MRLIDADELKKALAKNITIWTFNISYDGILAETIDNAPTVTSFTLEDIEGIRAETIKMMKNRYERPQGEWLPNYTSQFFNPGKQCSLCGKIVEFSENYCPQCGAYMRGDI